MLELKNNGDLLEREYYDSVCSSFSNYQIFWASFIGNDGNNHLTIILDDEVADRRKKLAQLSYTIFESVVSLYRISKKSYKAQDIESYLDIIDNFMLFYCHLGRIRDCVDQLGSELNCKVLGKELNGYYWQRNIVIHGKKIPLTFFDKQVMFAKLKKNETDSSKNTWHDSLDWDDIHEPNFESLEVVYTEIYQDIISKLNGIYSNMISNLKKDPKMSKVYEMMKNAQPVENKNSPLKNEPSASNLFVSSSNNI